MWLYSAVPALRLACSPHQRGWSWCLPGMRSCSPRQRGSHTTCFQRGAWCRPSTADVFPASAGVASASVRIFPAPAPGLGSIGRPAEQTGPYLYVLTGEPLVSTQSLSVSSSNQPPLPPAADLPSPRPPRNPPNHSAPNTQRHRATTRQPRNRPTHRPIRTRGYLPLHTAGVLPCL